MSTVGELLILIAGNNAPLTAALAASRAEMAGFAASAEASGAAAGVGLNRAGLAGAALAGGMAIFGVESAKAASEFNAAMELIHTQAGAAQSEVEEMRAAILQLGPVVGFGPEQLAAALFHIESAGFRGKDALQALTLAAQGARVGHADLEDVTGALVGALNSGIGGIHTMSDAMGVMNSIVGAGDLRMQELAGAMTTGLLSAASTFGVSIQSIGSALADMTRQHIPAEEAATRLRMTLSLLGAPKDKAIADLKEIGIGATQLAEDMRSGGIVQAVEDLKSHLESSGLTAVQQAALISDAFGGGRSSSAIMTLLNSVDMLGQVQEQVTAGTGKFAEAWATTSAETQTAGERFTATLDDINHAVGDGFLPAADAVMNAIQPALTGLLAWTAANPGLAAGIVAVAGGLGLLAAAGIVVGPIMAGLATALGFIVGPTTLVAAAIGALAAHFGLLGEGPKAFVDGIADSLNNLLPATGPVRDAINFIANAFNALPGVVSGAISAVVSTFGPLINQFAAFITSGGVVKTVTDSIGTAFNIVRGVIDAIGTVISTVVGWLSTFVTHLLGARSAGDSMRGVFDTVLGILRGVGDAIGGVITFIGRIVGEADRLGVFRFAFDALRVVADAIKTVFGALGDTLSRAFELFGQVAGVVSGVVTTAFNALKGVFDGLAKIIQGIIDALKGVIDFAGKAAAAVGGIGGASGDAKSFQDQFREKYGRNPTHAEQDQYRLGTLPGFAEGGIVPGPIGAPQLAVVHGGEQVTPPGSSLGGTTLVSHTHVHLDGREIAEIVERQFFDNASAYSSGFIGSPQTS